MSHSFCMYCTFFSFELSVCPFVCLLARIIMLWMWMGSKIRICHSIPR